MDILYSRQEELHLLTEREVTVAGLGGVGSWLAIFAAMSGVPTLYLFDHDIVEESNRNRLPFCQAAVGRPKVDVVKEFAQAIRPDIQVVAVQAKLEGVLLKLQLDFSDVIVDCTDSYRSQYQIYEACRESLKRIRYIRVGYDGTHITVSSTVPAWGKIEEGEEEDTEYRVTPSWVVPPVIAAAKALDKLQLHIDTEVSLDIDEIGIPLLKKRSRLTSRCGRGRR